MRAQHISWGQVFHPYVIRSASLPVSSLRSALPPLFRISVPSSVFRSSDPSVFRAFGTPSVRLFNSRANHGKKGTAIVAAFCANKWSDDVWLCLYFYFDELFDDAVLYTITIVAAFADRLYSWFEWHHVRRATRRLVWAQGSLVLRAHCSGMFFFGYLFF